VAHRCLGGPALRASRCADARRVGRDAVDLGCRAAQRCLVRFSLDETFDVGQDTGTPVLEEYSSQMPFTFTGTLAKVTIDLK
jgi:arylsulfatase